jgi:hypothetical protein
MLYQGGKIKITIIILVVISLFACHKEQKDNDEKSYKKISVQYIGNFLNRSIYKQAVDSFSNWQKNKLSAHYVSPKDAAFEIDSLLCFNIEKNKFVTALLGRSFTGSMDGLTFFYGVKIKEKWYFFTGATCYLPRKQYQKDMQTPLSFAKLHEIAMEEVFNGYLKKNKQGKWEVNDNWFKNHFEGSGWGDFNRQSSNDWFLKGRRFKTKKEYYEACYLQKVKNNWHR